MYPYISGLDDRPRDICDGHGNRAITTLCIDDKKDQRVRLKTCWKFIENCAVVVLNNMSFDITLASNINFFTMLYSLRNR